MKLKLSYETNTEYNKARKEIERSKLSDKQKADRLDKLRLEFMERIKNIFYN